MIFDATINIGTILTLLGVLGSSFIYMNATFGRFNAVISRQDRSDERDKIADDRMKSIEHEQRKQTDLLVAMARFQEQMNSFRDRLARIESEVQDGRVRTQIGHEVRA